MRSWHSIKANNVSVSARMSAVTANVVIGQPANCSVFCKLVPRAKCCSCSSANERLVY